MRMISATLNDPTGTKTQIRLPSGCGIRVIEIEQDRSIRRVNVDRGDRPGEIENRRKN